MPLRTGSLASLAKSQPPSYNADQFCLGFTEQILSALDYLASEALIHRDVKPHNILYSCLSDGRYLFQLADFGLAHYQSLAKTSCGTPYYQAPELYPRASGVNAAQSSKIDIWSLFATIAAVHSRFKEFPPATDNYGRVLNVLKAKAAQSSMLEPMARLHPDRRASAAQMLVYLFEGRGLTTALWKIPPIEPNTEDVPQINPAPGVQPTRNDRDKAPRPAREAARPLIVYKPRRRAPPPKQSGNHAQPAAPQFSPIRAHRDGVVKHRVQPSTASARTNAHARLPPGRKPPPETEFRTGAGL